MGVGVGMGTRTGESVTTLSDRDFYNQHRTRLTDAIDGLTNPEMLPEDKRTLENLVLDCESIGKFGQMLEDGTVLTGSELGSNEDLGISFDSESGYMVMMTKKYLITYGYMNNEFQAVEGDKSMASHFGIVVIEKGTNNMLGMEISLFDKGKYNFYNTKKRGKVEKVEDIKVSAFAHWLLGYQAILGKKMKIIKERIKRENFGEDVTK